MRLAGVELQTAADGHCSAWNNTVCAVLAVCPAGRRIRGHWLKPGEEAKDSVPENYAWMEYINRPRKWELDNAIIELCYSVEKSAGNFVREMDL